MKFPPKQLVEELCQFFVVSIIVLTSWWKQGLSTRLWTIWEPSLVWQLMTMWVVKKKTWCGLIQEWDFIHTAYLDSLSRLVLGTLMGVTLCKGCKCKWSVNDKTKQYLQNLDYIQTYYQIIGMEGFSVRYNKHLGSVLFCKYNLIFQFDVAFLSLNLCESKF